MNTETMPLPTTNTESDNATSPVDDTLNDNYLSGGMAPPVANKPKRIDLSDTTTTYRDSFFEWLFPFILAGTIALGIVGGIIAHSTPPLKRSLSARVKKIRTEFHFNEPKRIEPVPQPVIRKVEKKSDKEPVDLTRMEPKPTIQEEPAEPTPAPDPTPVKKVFGLRKVYATGLGSGGTNANGVVAKIGNTINKEYDTVTATEAEIKGTVVSVVSITSAPKFIKIVKPLYTKEMLEQKVEGTIKVKVLVDIDGRVKKATSLNDIGYGSAAEAVKATLKMLFEPGMRDTEPVAVWIIVPITFTLLG